MQNIDEIKTKLFEQISSSDNPREILKSAELKQLYGEIKNIAPENRAEYGQKINDLKSVLDSAIIDRESNLRNSEVEQIDITAPFDINASKVNLLPAEQGTQHPLTTEIENVIDIFTRMGFEAIESRQLDDEQHMFDMLNFPKGHPARDGYDTFRTEEGLIPPAHTSTMQNRILKAGKAKLESGGSAGQRIAAISYGRVFRNEDVDATHEHTFYQCEGVFVSEDANFAQLIGILKKFLETYYGQKLNTKTQPGYFPFTEPSIEFLIEKPASIGGKPGEWLELVPGGVIHPNVLEMAGIDSTKYRGFAWGLGLERLVMMKYGIEDLRLFESGKLAFLREFV